MAEIKKDRRDYGQPTSDPAGGKYERLARALLESYLSRPSFSYDPEEDPAYLAYRDAYTAAGRRAMEDAYASAASLTGGYGNSYAMTAGAAAYQSYLDRLNDALPELYSAAYKRYQQDNDEAYRRYNAAFGYYDSLSDRYESDRKFYSALDQQDYDDAYKRYADALAYDKWLSEFEYKKRRDAVSDDQWDRKFDYNKARDAVSDSQWERKHALDRARYARFL
ncbi:MAG: hypothetical protein IJR90_02250 [Clostridia bacterium]|nr:hypothetical protein [Clostridia bacterium]